MIQRTSLFILFFGLVCILLFPHGASAQTYNWSFGYPGSPGCVPAGAFPVTWAVCSTPEAACSSIAGVEFNGLNYVSPSVQSNGQGGLAETAFCNYFYGPWNEWTGIGLSTSCPTGQVSDDNSPPGCAPSGPGGPQSDKRLGGATASEVDQLQDSSSSCPAKCSAGDGSTTLTHLGTASAGEPIDVSSGNVFYETVDYRTSGQNKLGFMRFFNSRGFTDSVLGSHWRSNYSRFLYISAGGVIAERADGQKLTFVLNGSGAWITDTDVDYTLTRSGSSWTLTSPDDTVETYTTNSAGSEALLSASRLRNGYTQTLTYNALSQLTSVTDSYSRTLTFTYNSNNTLDSVVTPDETTITYGYTAGTGGINLTSVTWPTSPASTVTYGYTNALVPNALTSITDENGNISAAWTYDAFGRGLTSQTWSGSNARITSVSYNDSTGSRIVTNPLGLKDTYTFVTLQNAPKVAGISRAATSTTAAASETISYDANGYVSRIIDWNGNQTNYVNNAHGQPTTISEAVGSPVTRTTTILYDPVWVHVPDTITTPGLTVSFTYDADGEQLTKTLSDTTTTTAPYSTKGQSRVWTNTWSDSLLASVKSPNGNVTSFGYDSTGSLISITDALKHVSRITEHTAGGLPETVVDPNGITTAMTYSPRQWLTSRAISTTTGLLSTNSTYYPNGELEYALAPDGSGNTNLYGFEQAGSGDVYAIADRYDNQIDHYLDALGDSTQTLVFDPSGNIDFWRTASFDALGRKLQDTSTVTGKSTSWSYDKNGNALTITDPLGHMTTRAFDALNRLGTSTDANGGVVSETYDAHDRPLTVKDPRGNVTSYVYDGFGDLIQQTSPDSGITVYHYDKDGNLASKTDAAGVITNYSYDALDRRLTTTYPADSTENVTLTYDQTGHGFGIGRLTSLVDASGSLSRTYDERGDILTESRTNGGKTLTTAYTYDKAQRIASIKYPSGAIVSYTRDLTGNVTAMPFSATNSDQQDVGWFAHLPFGPVNSINYNNGDLGRFTFDQDYRLTTLLYETYQGVPYFKWAYGYDAANNTSSIADSITPANSQSFGYDLLNRLTSASSSGTYGNLTWAFGKNGNITNTLFFGITSVYKVSPSSNQLPSLTYSGNTDTNTYTPTGNGSVQATNGTTVITSTYNKANQLFSVIGPPLAISGMTYDAFGRRITKSNPGYSPILYTYDLDGNLIEENDGGAITDYIYLDGLNVANWEPSEKHLYAINFDARGVPQVSRDEYGLTNWAAYSTPDGLMVPTVTSGAFTGPVTQNLRLPGQYFDLEDDLHYNGARYYQPLVGRYTGPDPIGLAGGLNTYLYANANPLKFADKSGLDVMDAVGNSLEDTVVEKGVNSGLQSINVPAKVSEPIAKACAIGVSVLRDTGELRAPEFLWAAFTDQLQSKVVGGVENNQNIQQAGQSLLQQVQTTSNNTSASVFQWLMNTFPDYNQLVNSLR